jgi:hypothetical protein
LLDPLLSESAIAKPVQTSSDWTAMHQQAKDLLVIGF